MSEKAEAMTDGRGVRLLVRSRLRFMLDVEERSSELVEESFSELVKWSASNISLESARLCKLLPRPTTPSIVAVAIVVTTISEKLLSDHCTNQPTNHSKKIFVYMLSTFR